MNGKEMKELRLLAGYTQSQLAEKLGYFSSGKPNRSHIAKLECGFQPIGERIALSVRYVCEAGQKASEASAEEPKPKTWQSLLENIVEDEDAPVVFTDHVSSDSSIL